MYSWTVIENRFGNTEVIETFSNYFDAVACKDHWVKILGELKVWIVHN